VTQHHDLESVVAPEVDTAEEMPTPATAIGSPWSDFRHAMGLYVAVALGSVIGAVLRAIASLVILHHLGPTFPWGTLFANITGSFVIGFYAALTGPDGRVFAGARQRQFVMTGICGGYTTFSVFSLETLRLLQIGNLTAAALNVGVSIISWLAAVWLGYVLATRLNRLRRS
jgi:CrcB protein